MGTARVSAIDNHGPNTVLSDIRRLARRSKAADIAVAFVTVGGVDALLTGFGRLRQSGVIRIVVGLRDAFSEPRALRKLLEYSAQSRGRCEVRVATNLQFHEKLYCFSTANVFHVLCGSANLSSAAFTMPGELMVRLDLGKNSAPALEFRRHFQRLWQKESVELTAEFVIAYRKIWTPPAKAGVAHGRLRSILGATRPLPRSLRRKATGEPVAQRLWKDAIVGSVGKATEALVDSETGWPESWPWMSSDGHSYKRGDLIVLFDGTKKRRTAELVRVVDRTRVSERTPDGRDFVAYKPVLRRRWRVANAALAAQLRQAGVPPRGGWKERVRIPVGALPEVEALFR